jgi:hypothetical protein
VWRSNNDRWAFNCCSNLFQNSNVLVLLDPLEATRGGAMFTERERMLILAASNHEKHCKSIGKFTGDYARFLNCFSDTEMKISLPFMIEDTGTGPLLQMDKVLGRAIKVGNLPQYVLEEALFVERLQQTANAIETMKRVGVKNIMPLDGIIKSYSPVSKFIFEVGVNLDSISAMGKAANTDNDELCQYKTSNMQNMEKVGYDGQLVPDYGNRVVSIISKHVLSSIINS